MTNNDSKVPGITWAVPEELGIPPDKLRLRLDFYHQATTITFFEQDTVVTKTVDALDVSHALASDLSFGTGLLPENTLWWQNTRSGPVFAIYTEPKIWKVALEVDIDKPAKRFTIPLPGMIFLCSPGQAPWVYSVKEKPTKETDIVYKAPLPNVYNNGRSCPGSHKYPLRVHEAIQSFFMAFFSKAGDTDHRSNQFPKSVILLWEFLDGKKKFPMTDLVRHGTVKDLMSMLMTEGRVNHEMDDIDD